MEVFGDIRAAQFPHSRRYWSKIMVHRPKAEFPERSRQIAVSFKTRSSFICVSNSSCRKTFRGALLCCCISTAQNSQRERGILRTEKKLIQRANESIESLSEHFRAY